jgi:ubiquinone/menaquinone biosynthesis C-methylase UbiE
MIMANIERTVASHYGDAGLLDRIRAGLAAAGIDQDRIDPDALAPVEEFHTGGRMATEHAVSSMDLRSDDSVLDVGCGIGGAARYIAHTVGCMVKGIDITPEYIDCAETLTRATGLNDRASFEVASALAIPCHNNTFDAALTMHVAMNIPQRPALYREIARTLKPGATLCIFDIMKGSGDPLSFPVPWAQSDDASFLTTPEEMLALLTDAGFAIRDVTDRTEFALQFFRQAMANSAGGPPPPLGIHLILGRQTGEKLGNTLRNIEAGRIAPVQIIATRNPG